MALAPLAVFGEQRRMSPIPRTPPPTVKHGGESIMLRGSRWLHCINERAICSEILANYSMFSIPYLLFNSRCWHGCVPSELWSLQLHIGETRLYILRWGKQGKWLSWFMFMHRWINVVLTDTLVEHQALRVAELQWAWHHSGQRPLLLWLLWESLTVATQWPSGKSPRHHS